MSRRIQYRRVEYTVYLLQPEEKRQYTQDIFIIRIKWSE